MEEFTPEELQLLMFLVRNRLKYESQRKSYVRNGIDIQAIKVLQLRELLERLEEVQLAV